MGMPADRAEEKWDAPPPNEAAGERVVVGAETPVGFGMLNSPVVGMVEILGELAPGVSGLGMLNPPLAGMVGILGAPTLGPVGPAGLGMPIPPAPGATAPGVGATLTPLGEGMLEKAGPGPRMPGEAGLGKLFIPGYLGCETPGRGGGTVPPGGRMPG